VDGAKIRLWGDLLCKKGHDPYMVDVLRDSRLGCTVSASSPSFVCCVCVGGFWGPGVLCLNVEGLRCGMWGTPFSRRGQDLC
jgi:hypothetical protein